jgi:hypothetical protein
VRYLVGIFSKFYLTKILQPHAFAEAVSSAAKASGEKKQNKNTALKATVAKITAG